MILAFALETILCAGVAAVLFVMAWLDGYTPVTVLAGAVLMPLLVLAILAARVAL